MLINASHLTAVPGKSAQLRDLMPKLRDTLHAASGAEWFAWAAVTGRPYGSFVLSSRFENYTEMLTSQAKVAMSQKWLDLSAGAAGVLAEAAPTTLGEVIAVAGEPTGPKQFALVTRAIIDRTAMLRALAWATEIAEYSTKVTGVPTTVATSAAGTMFEVTWIGSVDTPEELDKMNAIGSDAGYLELLAQAGSEQLFQQGASERVLLSKLA